MDKSGEFRESLKEAEIAWIAGFIDGEGCLTIQRGYTSKTTRRKVQSAKDSWVWFRPRLSVHNTDAAAVQYIADFLNVSVWRRKMKSSNLRPIYSAELYSRKGMLRVLPILIPHLRVKKELAKYLYRLVCCPHGSGHVKENIFKEFSAYSESIGQSAVGRRNHKTAILSQASG